MINYQTNGLMDLLTVVEIVLYAANHVFAGHAPWEKSQIN